MQNMEISFNKPPYVGNEEKYMHEAVNNLKISGNGDFTNRCDEWFEKRTGCQGVLLTTSCSHSLELAALASKIKPGDEVIMPSYTFVSTANAFVVRGAVPVFVDIRPDTMNIDEKLIENAITKKTKAIAPVHYAGVSCEMDKIMELARKYNLSVIEDAAQGVLCTYKGKALGTIGDYGCYSFHETKNFSMGEGGAILVNNSDDIELIEIMREKGTDRKKFLRGQVDKYSWVEMGSSYLPSDLNAAYLWAQLERADIISASRMRAWKQYREELDDLYKCGKIELQTIPKECIHNAHMFYIKVKNIEQRTRLISFLKENGVQALFHYVPLHSAPAGRRFGYFAGEDRYTTSESERLLRLPMYYGLNEDEVSYVTELVKKFFSME